MKKGQSAGNAAILVASVVGLILLYILFLPPDERAELLGENETKAVKVSEPARTLLKENPGTLFKSKQDEFEHKVNSFNLYARNEEAVIKSLDSVYVEAKRGNSKARSVAFSVDPTRTSNPQLGFDARNHNGRLIIKLNDEEVFNGEAAGQMTIALESLQDDNVLQFSSEEVGFQFWRTNFYEIRDLKVSAVVSNPENLVSTQTFIVGGDEANNVERASVTYFVDCRIREAGVLKVSLNSVLLASSVPDCGSPAKIQVDPSIIARGTNSLRFASDEGTFLVDQVFVRTVLKEPVEPVYFFEVNKTQWRWLQNDTFDAVLRMQFIDDDEEKRAELNINNRKTFMDAEREANFSRNIDSFLVEGNNFIKITPEKTFNLVELTIKLE